MKTVSRQQKPRRHPCVRGSGVLKSVTCYVTGTDEKGRSLIRHTLDHRLFNARSEAGETGVGAEPFLLVDHPLIAIPVRGGGELCWVGPTLRLGHDVTGHHLVLDQRPQIAFRDISKES